MMLVDSAVAIRRPERPLALVVVETGTLTGARPHARIIIAKTTSKKHQ